MTNRSLQGLKTWARALKRDVLAIWIAAHDARTPRAAKIVAGAVAAYALSPIDLIPDFIPILGYLDDLIVVPLGVALVVRLVPPDLMAEFRALASARPVRPRSYIAAVLIVALWLVCGATLWLWWQAPR